MSDQETVPLRWKWALRRAAAACSLAIIVGMFIAGGASAAVSYERVTLKDGERLLLIKGEFESADDPMKLVAEFTQF